MKLIAIPIEIEDTMAPSTRCEDTGVSKLLCDQNTDVSQSDSDPYVSELLSEDTLVSKSAIDETNVSSPGCNKRW